MPVLDQIPSTASKISDSLKDGFKKNEKENYENHLAPTVKQVLNAKIEYEEAPNHANSALNTLQAKYIVLKANQPPSQQATNASPNQASYAKVLKSNDGNERSTSSTSSINSSSSSASLQLPKPKRELYDKGKIQIGWNQQGIVSKWGSGQGFNNVGNTCYLNSALQAFLHVPAIAQWLISDKEHRDKCQKDNFHNMCIICAMAQTLLNSHRNNGSTTPSLITNRLHQICKHLTHGRQEDAHEFLRYLIEKMERSYLFRFKNEMWFKELDQYSKETTPLNHLLGGYLRSTVTCLSCHHDSVTFQHFEDLPLDISKVNKLSEAIDGYFSRENLEECGYKCESCKRRVSAAKKFTLERAPLVLCVQLKRFSALGGKITKPITITEKLSLHKYLSKTADTNQNCTYRFVSMVQHHGSSSSGGHYTAVGMAPNGNFYAFDDSRVGCLSLEQALKASGYILFYELDKSSIRENGHTRMQNGHSVLIQNGHSYSKSNVEPTSSLASPTISYAAAASSSSSFSKPSLPQIIPHTVLKQQQQQKQQKENTEASPSKNGVKSPGVNGENQRVAPLTTMKLSNGLKHDNNSVILNPSPGVLATVKQCKTPNGCSQSNLPSMPKISDDEEEEVKSNGVKNLSISTTPPTTPTKPLVPYDDDDDEEMDTKEKIALTSAGPFYVIDSKENAKIGPSVAGSTIVTKAMSDQSVKRCDDPIQQLNKLHHNGYGSSIVLSWNNESSKMNHEVSKDQQREDRKRPHERDDDFEMDQGKIKKCKIMYSKSPPRSNGKLPNPFQDAQNKHNGNGHRYDRPSNNHSYNNQNGNYRHHNNVYNNGYNYNNHQKKGHSYNNGYKNHRNHNNYNRHNRNFHNSNNYSLPYARTR